MLRGPYKPIEKVSLFPMLLPLPIRIRKTLSFKTGQLRMMEVSTYLNYWKQIQGKQSNHKVMIEWKRPESETREAVNKQLNSARLITVASRASPF